MTKFTQTLPGIRSKRGQISTPSSPNPGRSPSATSPQMAQNDFPRPGPAPTSNRLAKKGRDLTAESKLNEDQVVERDAKRQLRAIEADPNTSPEETMVQQPGTSGLLPPRSGEQCQTGPEEQESGTTSSLDKDLPARPLSARDIIEANGVIDDLTRQVSEGQEEIERLRSHVSRLQKKVTDTAASRTEGDPLAGSRLPETEITKTFHSLTYRVHNFLVNYYKDPGKKEVKLWAEGESRRLVPVHPEFVRLAMDKASAAYFVESAIWVYLMNEVFYGYTTSGRALWAGRYAARLNRLSEPPFPSFSAFLCCPGY